MKTNRFLLLLFFILPFIVISQNQNQLGDLFPKSGQFDGCLVRDSVEFFTGDDLFEFINGGADIYLEYGFKQVAHCTYMDSLAVKIHLEIYEMTQNDAAYGIYTLNSSGKGVPINMGEQGILYDYYLHFYKANYYIRCSVSKKDPDMINTMEKFASFTDTGIKTKGKLPALMLSVDIEELEFREVKYIKGQIGLSNVFNFGHGAIANFNDGVVTKWAEKAIFVFSYDNDKKRREWFASAKGKMQMNKKFTEFSLVEDGFTVKDKNGLFFSFKPSGRFFIILKGFNWEEAKPVFEAISENLEKVGPVH
ncbi:MAG: hypothetical protein K9H49_01165 [Bacteroidales bacterium]|nr:hypothetical protein [Bacteroidales bacterium]MCF8403807.1 hypothetical protein [Bacteroidales bacterium]